MQAVYVEFEPRKLTYRSGDHERGEGEKPIHRAVMPRSLLWASGLHPTEDPLRYN